MIKKDMLRHFKSIRSNNTEISKTLNVGKSLVVRCAKHHRLIDILTEPEDENVILQVSCEGHQFQKTLAEIVLRVNCE